MLSPASPLSMGRLSFDSKDVTEEEDTFCASPVVHKPKSSKSKAKKQVFFFDKEVVETPPSYRRSQSVAMTSAADFFDDVPSTTNEKEFPDLRATRRRSYSLNDLDEPLRDLREFEDALAILKSQVDGEIDEDLVAMEAEQELISQSPDELAQQHHQHLLQVVEVAREIRKATVHQLTPEFCQKCIGQLMGLAHGDTHSPSGANYALRLVLSFSDCSRLVIAVHTAAPEEDFFLPELNLKQPTSPRTPPMAAGQQTPPIVCESPTKRPATDGKGLFKRISTAGILEKLRIKPRRRPAMSPQPSPIRPNPSSPSPSSSSSASITPTTPTANATSSSSTPLASPPLEPKQTPFKRVTSFIQAIGSKSKAAAAAASPPPTAPAVPEVTPSPCMKAAVSSPINAGPDSPSLTLSDFPAGTNTRASLPALPPQALRDRRNCRSLRLDGENLPPMLTKAKSTLLGGSKEKVTTWSVGREDFVFLKPIGKGGFGTVWLARYIATGAVVAIKAADHKQIKKKNQFKYAVSECTILRDLDSQFVVRLFSVFQTKKHIYLVMEFVPGGDLFSLLQGIGCLPEDLARQYVAEMVLALDYLHSQGIVHRDIKPDNVLISKEGHIKLTDFGLSQKGHIKTPNLRTSPRADQVRGVHAMEDVTEGVGSLTIADTDSVRTPFITASSSSSKPITHKVAGTPDYLAPELLLGLGDGPWVDWWALGIILFECLASVPPYYGDTRSATTTNIISNSMTCPWPSISPAARSVIEGLLTFDYTKRLGTRGGAAEIQAHPFFDGVDWDMLLCTTPMFVPDPDDELDTSYFDAQAERHPSLLNTLKPTDDAELTADNTEDGCGSSSYDHEDRSSLGHSQEINVEIDDVDISYVHPSLIPKALARVASFDL